MEKFTYDELSVKNPSAAAALLSLLMDYSKKNGIEAFEEFIKPKEFQIELKINGVEFSFVPVIKEFSEFGEKEIQTVAAAMIDRKLSDIHSIICKAREGLKSKLSQAFPEAFQDDDR